MAVAHVHLTGAKEIAIALGKLETKLARKVASKALRAGAKVVLPVAQSLAPVKTGALRKAIKVRSGKNKKDFRSIVVAVGEKWFQGDEFYAAFIEFGWKTGSRSKGLDATVRRIATELRRQSREARKLGKGKGLAKRESAFRARQEAFFAREAARQASTKPEQVRQQVPGQHYMERAYEQTKEAALAKVMGTLAELTQGKP